MIMVYGIKNCGSVKKALSFLNDNNLEYTFVDFKASPVEERKITQWLSKSDLSILLNTKGTTYRNLDLKSISLNDSEKVAWMSKENRLIKRPVIEYGNHLIIGFDQPKYEGIFLS
jgi:Spx/MgsR family transcriptional regulator